jgi:hypothetical protein
MDPWIASSSMSSVYSTRFYEGKNVTSGTIVTVPAGYIAIVRDIDAFFGGGIEGGALNVIGTLGQTFAWFPFTGLTSAAFTWRGRQVFSAGESVRFVSGAGVDLTVSGYLLTAP